MLGIQIQIWLDLAIFVKIRILERAVAVRGADFFILRLGLTYHSMASS
jgi:hypothetical protein